MRYGSARYRFADAFARFGLMPNTRAFMRTPAAVRPISLAILVMGVLALIMALSLRTSSLVYSARWLVGFFANSASGNSWARDLCNIAT